jgi:tryptophan 2,3-dioxygenase
MVWFKDGPSPGEEKLTYEGYLRVADLLELQAPQSDPPEHDETMFIVVHQTYELWFRLILHELDEVARRMEAGDAREATRLLRRVVEIERVLAGQIHVLETMLPTDFLRFRDKLKPASGFQSAQFREIEFLAGLPDRSVLAFFPEGTPGRARLERRLSEPTLRDRFFRLLLGATGAAPPGSPERAARLEALCAIYRAGPDAPRALLDLRDLAEALLDFDEWLSLWRFHHVRMAEREIGSKPGTGGSDGVEYLASTIERKPKAFPEIWEVRTML